MSLSILLIAIHAQAMPATLVEQAECAAYRQLVTDYSSTQPAIRVGPERSQPSQEARELTTLKERLSAAVRANDVDLAAVAALMREHQQRTSAFRARLAAAETECAIASLNAASEDERRRLLQVLAPLPPPGSKALPFAPPAPPSSPKASSSRSQE